MMVFRGFKSPLPETPYAPTWNFKVGSSVCDDIDNSSLSKFLLKKQREVMKLPLRYYDKGKLFDGYTGLGKRSVTSRSNVFNLLSWSHPEVTKLRNNILKKIIEYNNQWKVETPSELWIQCWYNVLSFNQKMEPHHHSSASDCYLSGHYNVQVGNTSTCYMSPVNVLNDPEVIDLENKDGEMSLFPSYIFHYTTPHYSFKPRITIAFDINLRQTQPNFIRL